MTKTNEFRIKETDWGFAVQRKHKDGKKIEWNGFSNDALKENETMINGISYNTKQSTQFNQLENAKQFIDKLLQDEGVIPVEVEDCIYHTYP